MGRHTGLDGRVSKEGWFRHLQSPEKGAILEARGDNGEDEGIGAFVRGWSECSGHFHLSVELVTRVVRKAKRSGARRLLMAPGSYEDPSLDG